MKLVLCRGKFRIRVQKYNESDLGLCGLICRSRVNMVGSDTCSPDGLGSCPIHRQLLGSDILIIENLTNLDRLLGKTFTVYAFPIALSLDAAPARVVAHLTT